MNRIIEEEETASAAKIQEKTDTKKGITGKENTEKEDKDFSFRRDSQEGYLLAEGSTEMGDRVDVKMLLHNRILNFLPMQMHYIDEGVQYQYKISGMVSMESILQTRQADHLMLVQIMDGIIQALRAGQLYFLKEENYVLTLKWMFWNQWRQEIGICYYPDWNRDIDKQIVELIEQLMQRTDHSEKEGVAFIYGLYELLQQKGVWLEHVEEYVKSNSSIGKAEGERKAEVREPENKNREKLQGCEKKKDFEITWELKLYQGYMGLPEEILLRKSVTNVGRMTSNDLILPGAGISRSHAKLYLKEGRVFLQDCGSANGTRLNHKKIPARERIPCQEGDILSFAEISYQLNKYHTETSKQ